MRRTMVVLASGVAFAANVDCTTDPCLGTRGSDDIFGTENPETINALAGDDYIRGRDGNDIFYGEGGKDRVDAAGGNDIIYGGAGNDGDNSIGLVGAEDSDTIYGGKGNDVIDAAAFDQPLESPDSPVDYSYGESGNDTIKAEDGNVDIIDCGAQGHCLLRRGARHGHELRDRESADDRSSGPRGGGKRARMRTRGRGVAAPALPLALIHPSSGKISSQKLAVRYAAKRRLFVQRQFFL